MVTPTLHRLTRTEHGGVRCIVGFDDQPPKLEKPLFESARVAAGVKAREHDDSLLFGSEEDEVGKAPEDGTPYAAMNRWVHLG